MAIEQDATRGDGIMYWTTTGIVVGVMLLSGLNFAFNPAMKGAFAHLGLPNWFRVELTVAKLLGSFALLIPAVPHRIKEFAYAGFAHHPDFREHRPPVERRSRRVRDRALVLLPQPGHFVPVLSQTHRGNGRLLRGPGRDYAATPAAASSSPWFASTYEFRSSSSSST